MMVVIHMEYSTKSYILNMYRAFKFELWTKNSGKQIYEEFLYLCHSFAFSAKLVKN